VIAGCELCLSLPHLGKVLLPSLHSLGPHHEMHGSWASPRGVSMDLAHLSLAQGAGGTKRGDPVKPATWSFPKRQGGKRREVGDFHIPVLRARSSPTARTPLL
jgi:hypothetical protein